MFAVALAASSLLTATRAAAQPASFYDDPTVRARGAVALIGDSLTFAAWADIPHRFEEQQWGPFQLEARSGRFTTTTTPSATSGIDAVRRVRAGGFDPPLWIVALGTNDMSLTAAVPGATAALIDTMMAEIGAGHRVVWVNLYKRGSPASTAAFNSQLVAATARHPALSIADWHAVISVNQQWLDDDGVHLTLTGARMRNEFVARAATGVATAPSVCDPAPVAQGQRNPPTALDVGTATVPAVRLCHR